MSRWLKHIKATMASNPDVKKKHGLKGILKLASKTYKKGAKAADGHAGPVHKKHTRHHKRASGTHKRKTAKHHKKHSGKKHHKKSSKKKSAKHHRRRKH